MKKKLYKNLTRKCSQAIYELLNGLPITFIGYAANILGVSYVQILAKDLPLVRPEVSISMIPVTNSVVCNENNDPDVFYTFDLPELTADY